MSREHLISLLIAVLAFSFAIFQARPEPPQSPIIYQWETDSGHYTEYKQFKIFFKDLNGTLKNAETLVVLHGFPTSSFDFYLLKSSLRKTFNRVIFIDFLGFGFSDKPRNHIYTIAEQADIVEYVLRKVKVSQFHILSHDFGNTVAQEIMARFRLLDYKFKLKSVAMLNGAIVPQANKMTYIQYLIKIPLVGHALSRFTNHIAFGRAINEVIGDTKLDSFTLTQLWYFARHKDGYRAWPNLLNYVEERKKYETRWLEAIQHSPAPVGVIYGPKDPLNPHPTFYKAYFTSVRHARVEMLNDDVGHYPQLEDPVALMSEYSDFLKIKVGLEVDQENITVVLPEKIPPPEPI